MKNDVKAYTQRGMVTLNDGELPSELLKRYPYGITETLQGPSSKAKLYRETSMASADSLQVLCLEVCLVLTCVGVVAFVFLMLMLSW